MPLSESSGQETMRPPAGTCSAIPLPCAGVSVKSAGLAASETTVHAAGGLRGRARGSPPSVGDATSPARARRQYPLVEGPASRTIPQGLGRRTLRPPSGACTPPVEPPAAAPDPVERAQHGTLFFDEIAALPPASPVKLLRLCPETRVRAGRPAALRHAEGQRSACWPTTSADLEARRWKRARFSLDLYYGVNVFPIFLPALCGRRKDDILLLANRFVRQSTAGNWAGRTPPIARRPSARCRGTRWPGNVRELESTAHRICRVGLQRRRGSRPRPAAHAASVRAARGDFRRLASRRRGALGEGE